MVHRPANKRHKREVEHESALHRKLKGEGCERIESDADFVAVGALHSVLVESTEEIHTHRLIALGVVLSVDVAELLDVLWIVNSRVIGVGVLQIRLLLDSVEILMDGVDKIAEELLGVLLAPSGEHSVL